MIFSGFRWNGGERYIEHFEEWQHFVVVQYAMSKRFNSLRKKLTRHFGKIVRERTATCKVFSFDYYMRLREMATEMVVIKKGGSGPPFHVCF